MIRAIIKMDISGRGEEFYNLGAIDISNLANHKEHPKKGNYKAVFYTKHLKKFNTKYIYNHRRLDESIWSLLRKVLGVEKKLDEVAPKEVSEEISEKFGELIESFGPKDWTCSKCQHQSPMAVFEILENALEKINNQD